jgi:UTP-glucose-1-phosphate uridylyltransferase
MWESVSFYDKIVNMKKTLLVMAAGMGTRYGGLKQIDSVGPNGEYLIDYSVYDAIKVGFDKVVFVIKREFAREFKKHFSPTKFKNKIKIEYAYQDLNDLPIGFKLPKDRKKPWGTGHAILAARNFIKEPFVVVSADDFYGREAYKIMAQELEILGKNSQNRYLLVGYRLGKTLSDHGWVARGICKVDDERNLTSIYEHTRIGRVKGKIVSRDKYGNDYELDEERLVSMVMFGFTVDFFSYLQISLISFLDEKIKIPEIEFFTPNVVNELVQTRQVTMKVVPTTSHWFGMTYKQDKIAAMAEIRKLIDAGIYPSQLW